MPVSADGVRVAFVAETGTPPTTPLTPVFTSARITGESLAFNATTIVSAELDPSAQVRDSILVGGESTGGLNLEVSSHEAFDTYLAAVFGGAWVADVLIPGTSLPTYTVEKTFPGVPVPGESSYHRFVNSAFNAVNMSITPGQAVTAVANITGGPLSLDTDIIAGATYPDPGINPVLVPQDVVISLAGMATSTCFGAFTMDFTNGLRGVQCIGTLGNREVVRGRFEVAFTGNLYYATDDIVQEFLSQGEFTGSVELQDSSGASEYLFEFPRLKVKACPIVAGGTGQDVVIALTMQALYDPTLGYTCQVTRTTPTPPDPLRRRLAAPAKMLK